MSFPSPALPHVDNTRLPALSVEAKKPSPLVLVYSLWSYYSLQSLVLPRPQKEQGRAKLDAVFEKKSRKLQERVAGKSFENTQGTLWRTLAFRMVSMPNRGAPSGCQLPWPSCIGISWFFLVKLFFEGSGFSGNLRGPSERKGPSEPLEEF